METERSAEGAARSRVAGVTGGARGIGRGRALALAEHGFDTSEPSFIAGQGFVVDGFKWVL